MKTILVTGGAGFIGSHLCERLIESGYDVLCVDNFNDSYDPLIKKRNILKSVRHCNYHLIEGDILDSSLIDRIASEYKIDAIVHLAALTGVRKSILAPLDYVDVDIKGTVSLLEACKKYGIGKFVFASSSSVYGEEPTPFKEEAPLNGQASPYAAAKLAGELFCKTYSLLYGIKIACLRFFTVYGPRQRPDMAIHIFTNAISEGREICVYGDGSSSRDYTYIDDIVDGTIASLSLENDFEIINLGNSNRVNILNLAGTIAEVLNKDAQIAFQPYQKGDVSTTCADISKAATLLKYSPKIDLKEGVKRFVQWMVLENKREDSLENQRDGSSF